MRYAKIYYGIVIGFFVLMIIYTCYSIYEEHTRNVWEREMRESRQAIHDRGLRQK